MYFSKLLNVFLQIQVFSHQLDRKPLSRQEMFFIIHPIQNWQGCSVGCMEVWSINKGGFVSNIFACSSGCLWLSGFMVCQESILLFFSAYSYGSKKSSIFVLGWMGLLLLRAESSGDWYTILVALRSSGWQNIMRQQQEQTITIRKGGTQSTQVQQ